jgi:hypothetical protein
LATFVHEWRIYRFNYFVNVNSGRGKGRPRVEWEEYVEGLARKRGRRLPEVRRLAQDRDDYRKWMLKPDD